MQTCQSVDLEVDSILVLNKCTEQRQWGPIISHFSCTHSSAQLGLVDHKEHENVVFS